MATVGRTTVGGTSGSIESGIFLTQVLMPEHGTIHTIWAHILESTTPNTHSVMAVLLASAPTIGLQPSFWVRYKSHNAGARYSTVGRWYPFQLEEAVFVQSGDPVCIGLFSGGGGGTINCSLDVVAGTPSWQTGAATGFPVLPNPSVPVAYSANTNRYSLYAEYTPGDTRVQNVVLPPSFRPADYTGDGGKAALNDIRAWW